jgi:hypothetical protein
VSARFDIDFVQAHRPVGAAAWILLVLGLAASTAAAIVLQSRWEAGDAQQAEAQRLAEALHRATAPGPEVRGADAARAGGPERGAQQRQAARVIDELRRPWGALFAQMEGAGLPTVHLVQFGVDARFEALSMQVEARSLHEVLRYAQRLSGAGPIRAVQLVSHEWREAPGGRVVTARLAVELDAGAAASGTAASGTAGAR